MVDICEVLREAVVQKATDVYLKVGCEPRMRKNGKLFGMNFPKLLAGDVLDCVLKILDEEQREILEERGEFVLSYNAPSIGRYRVSIYKSRDMVSMVFRRIRDIEDIVKEFGMPGAVMELACVKKGMLIFAGDGGSGRTTGIASLINKMNEECPVHIVTMENPIEILHESKNALVDQREAGCDYVDLVCGIEQTDKMSVDVLVCEEKLNAEVLEKLCECAETGKLVVFSTNGTHLSEVIDGLVSMFAAEEQNQFRKRLSKVLQAVVISKQMYTEETVQKYEVIKVDEQIRNRICYSR